MRALSPDRAAKIAVEEVLGKVRRRHAPGKLNPRFVAGKWRRIILQETTKRCVRALYGNRCAQCNTKRRLEIHHIIASIYGGDNELDNLALLCHDCHQEAHAEDKAVFFSRNKTKRQAKLGLDNAPNAL